MPLKYAAFTVMTPEFTLEETVAILKQLGYDGIEWRVHNVHSDFADKPDYWRSNRATVDINTIVEKAGEIRKLTEDHGLEILGLGTYPSYKSLDDVERCMEAAKIMGTGSVRVSPPGYDGSQNYNDLYELAMDRFTKIEELARRYQIRANIEIHNGTSAAAPAWRIAL